MGLRASRVSDDL